MLLFESTQLFDNKSTASAITAHGFQVSDVGFEFVWRLKSPCIYVGKLDTNVVADGIVLASKSLKPDTFLLGSALYGFPS